MKSLLLALGACMIYGVWSSPAVPFGVNNKCDLGEAYWCKSREIARWCNREQYCIHIWIKRPRLDNSHGHVKIRESRLKGGFGGFDRIKKWTKPQCEFCKHMLGQVARDFLVNNVGTKRNKEQVKSSLQPMCRNIFRNVHFAGMRPKEECEKMVRDHGSEIVDFMIKGASSEYTCMALKFCSPFGKIFG